MQPLVFNPDVFALGLAVGVLGLVLLLSLIISYAYEERSLLFLSAYVSVMAALLQAGERLGVDIPLIQRLLLVTGATAVAGLQMWLLRVRQASRTDRFVAAAVVLSSLLLLGFDMAADMADIVTVLCLVWVGVLAGTGVYGMVKSWDVTGPWKWWLILGHSAGLVVAAVFLTGISHSSQPYWSVVLMLLLQVPPIYLSLVWRSRLLNEIRLRSAAANVVDPLTGLATTPVLVERLMRVMSREQQARHNQTQSAIFLIHVQNWMGLLNQLGPDFGEKLLLEVALRLRRSVGDNDLVARINGGRFAVVAQGLASDHEVTSLATRLVVSGLRIDSPLLPGVEFKLRVIVGPLRLSKPMTLPATNNWLDHLAARFDAWPGSHRSRSILTLTEEMEKSSPSENIGTAADKPDSKNRGISG